MPSVHASMPPRKRKPSTSSSGAPGTHTLYPFPLPTLAWSCDSLGRGAAILGMVWGLMRELVGKLHGLTEGYSMPWGNRKALRKVTGRRRRERIGKFGCAESSLAPSSSAPAAVSQAGILNSSASGALGGSSGPVGLRRHAPGALRDPGGGPSSRL